MKDTTIFEENITRKFLAGVPNNFKYFLIYFRRYIRDSRLQCKSERDFFL